MMKRVALLLLAGALCTASGAYGVEWFKKAEVSITKAGSWVQENIVNKAIASAQKAIKAGKTAMLKASQKALQTAHTYTSNPRKYPRLHRFNDKVESLLEQVNNALGGKRPAKEPRKQAALPLTKKDQKGYIALDLIRPGQSRYAEPNVKKKMKKAVEKLQTAKLENGNYTPLADKGQSTIPLKGAVPVIIGPFENKPYVLVDGHHDVLAALRMGSTTVPVKVVADMRGMSEKAFYDKAAAQGYIYYKQLGGAPAHQYPTSFEQLTEDPYRWFAAVISRKCPSKSADMETESETEAKEGSYAWAHPVLIKSDVKGEDTPFVEFIVADVLYNNIESESFIHQIKSQTNNPSQPLVERARGILAAKFKKGKGKPEIRLVPEATAYTNLSCDYPVYNPKS